MTSAAVRALVVDDSAVIRALIGDTLGRAPGLQVAATADDGRRALDLLDAVRPDVITLDVHMPNMDGLTTLEAILARRPVPVVMVSALTRQGAEITLEALDRGAVDYVAKPERGADQAGFREELLRKVRNAAGCDVRRILEIRRARRQRRREQPSWAPIPKELPDACPVALREKCVAIGISTGGPPALSRIFEALRPPLPPIVVVQHMPAHFTRPLAWRLDSLSRLSIREAANGDVLRPNHVLIAPGGKHLQLRRQEKWVKAVIRDGEPVSGHRPSIDVMMTCAAEIFGPGCLGVIMTGMGRDGSAGCRAIRAAGGFVLGQDEQSSEVYGMNKVAFVEGHVDRQFALPDATAAIVQQLRQMACAGPPPLSS